MNHENKDIIEKAFTPSMLLNIIQVSFNPNSNYSKIINIPWYLIFLEHNKLNMNNHFSINESKLYEEVVLIEYYDVFPIVIYQYDKNVKSVHKITNIISLKVFISKFTIVRKSFWLLDESCFHEKIIIWERLYDKHRTYLQRNM